MIVLPWRPEGEKFLQEENPVGEIPDREIPDSPPLDDCQEFLLPPASKGGLSGISSCKNFSSLRPPREDCRDFLLPPASKGGLSGISSYRNFSSLRPTREGCQDFPPPGISSYRNFFFKKFLLWEFLFQEFLLQEIPHIGISSYRNFSFRIFSPIGIFPSRFSTYRNFLLQEFLL